MSGRAVYTVPKAVYRVLRNYSMNSERDNSSVQVAVRIRPLIQSEKDRGCQDILEVFPGLHQIRVKNSDKAFTYNYVCDGVTTQDTFYNMCIKHMIENLFKGYNMTILAYGQTGSGKTHSMGTAYTGEGEMGVIPRAINDIFNYVNDNFTYDFNITVSFMELYQEVLYDLLATKPRDQCVVEIREDPKGLIVIPGLTEEPVKSACKTLECLARGSLGRATGSTNMNSQSSRSHAIFTINICMQQKSDSNMNKTAKFHLVDLAGSERSKKTGATGVTFQEGVNINKGLLALGNVISALGSENRQGFISYRDSNLTRLLKDSLGGNSITLMIACVSPADYNVEESLSTLRYADRARKIKNKPVINQDPKTAEINRLNKLVQQLRLELVGQGGPIISQAELEELRRKNDAQKTKIQQLTLQLSSTLNDNTALFERVMIMQSANECLSKKLLELKDEYNVTINNLNLSLEQNNAEAVKEHINKLHTIQNRFKDIDTDRLKTEEEIRRHERTVNTASVASTDLGTETEVSERQETHTKQQMALNSELQEVTKMLAMKEHLAQQMLANTNHLVDYNAIAENEAKVAALQAEKDDLLQQLKNVQVQGISNKIAEQRRKRVQELEKEIHDLHKKITEQARLIKLKEKDEQKIRQLNNEIQLMKQTKVKLIKNMKQESEKFRTWKLQRERELSKLKNQDRKRQNQIVKMETMLSRQQNVFKRKVEEAAAINKRLKDALALRKTVQDQKNSGKIERIVPWIQQELDVLVSTVDAEATLTTLLDDRATLHEQLDQLKSDPDTDINEIKQLEEEIDMRSTQIQDLQQKIIDSDQDNKSKSRWDNIQSMGEAKLALKTLFELTADIRKREVNNEGKINDLQNNQSEVIRERISKTVAEHQLQMKSIKAEYEHELSNMAKEYEEKIAVLLRHLRGVAVEGVPKDFQERLEIQQQQLEHTEKELEDVQLASQKLENENHDLKKRLEEIKQQQIHIPEVVITKPELKKKKANSSLRHIREEELVFLDTSTEVEDDNPNADPDWRKTPLAKRIQRIRSSSTIPAQPQDRGDRQTVKRGSDGGCACRTNCSRKSCGCKKFSKYCTSLCKCSDECLNQCPDKENETSTDEKSPKEDDEDPFKKPRSLFNGNEIAEVNSQPRRTKRTRTLFDF